MSYTAEPVPAGVDPVLAEYLNRQMILIQNLAGGAGSPTPPTVSEVPENIMPGAMVNLDRQDGGDKALNGMWACITDSRGQYVWKRLLPQET